MDDSTDGGVGAWLRARVRGAIERLCRGLARSDGGADWSRAGTRQEADERRAARRVIDASGDTRRARGDRSGTRGREHGWDREDGDRVRIGDGDAYVESDTWVEVRR